MLRNEFMGLLNLFWACSHGHDMWVHAFMEDQHISDATMNGTPERGYVIRVSIITVGLIIDRNVFFLFIGQYNCPLLDVVSYS